ncbi:MAG: tetratricopeptide repeat protein [Bacteroidales bacterium]|nr:tetratricopeptide repeat protein [Bacteroidales bacterium]
MQKINYLAVAVIALFLAPPLFAQKHADRERFERSYANALDLFYKEKYAMAQHQFDLLAREEVERRSDATFYAAVCSEKLGSDDANYRLAEFLRLYPESGHVNMVRFYQGNYHYSKQQYADALNHYLQASPSDIDYGHRNEYNFKVGYCLFVAGETDKAQGYFARVMGSPSKYQSSARYYYAHTQYRNGDYELALENFRKLENDRKFAKIVPNYVARIYYYLGREDDLLEMAPSLLRGDDVFRKAEVQQMIGEVYFNRGEYAQAIKYYTLARQDAEEEDNAVACNRNDNTYQMGYSFYILKQYDSAAAYLAKKVACNDSIGQNAVYTLADTYLKLNRKDDARSMFLEASQMAFDKKIQEDALFNYAKLGCELNKNPYNESIRSLEDYLKRYPATKHRAEIEEILTGLYLTTRNYKDALSLIEKTDPMSAEMKQAYQRCLIGRGIELFNGRDIEQSSEYFLKAAKVNAVPKSTTDAYYLYGEAQYRQGNKPSARAALEKFFRGSNAKNSPYYKQALYTDGYLKIETGDYANAGAQMRHFLASASDDVPTRQKYDAYNRLGDCLYAQKHFNEAVAQYDVVINANANDADYATYQKALCYGALGKNDQKLTYLNYLFERYETSTLAPMAALEIANTYLVLDNNEMALLYYNNFLKDYPQSSHVKEVLLNRGLIYYNTGRDSLALASLDQLLRRYPGTEEARDALATVKNIYLQQNRVDEYFAYVQETTKATVSSNEQDSTTYQVATNYYFEGDCDNAISSMERYLSRFPNGLFAQTAHYYLADCLFKSGLNEKALPHFEYLAERNKNQYTETALAHAAAIAYGLGNYTKALDNYVRLATLAEDDNSRLAARLGLLRSWNKMESHENIMASGLALLKEPKITADQRDEAHLYMARSLWKGGQRDSAAIYYTMLKKSSNGEYGGEAAYKLAEKLFLEKNYAASEKAIEAIGTNPKSDYWLAKSFILWSDIFYTQGNTLQAKQTLQSIIDNYEGDDLVAEALQKRNAILEAEATAAKASEDSINKKANEEMLINMGE